jgi:hypothetical protein
MKGRTVRYDSVPGILCYTARRLKDVSFTQQKPIISEVFTGKARIRSGASSELKKKVVLQQSCSSPKNLGVRLARADLLINQWRWTQCWEGTACILFDLSISHRLFGLRAYWVVGVLFWLMNITFHTLGDTGGSGLRMKR